jgi:hypothetical protein
MFLNLVKILVQVSKAVHEWQSSMIHPSCCFVTQGAKAGITGATVDGILAYDNAIEGGGRLCTVDLLIKVAWFVKKVNNISNKKGADLN